MIVFDTDLSLGTPGAEIDDGAALILLLRAAGERVAAVTTVHGNGGVDLVTTNTRRLLAFLGREEIPLGRGAAAGLIEEKRWFAAWQAGYGETPPWPGEPALPAAANLIVDTVRANPGRVTLLAVGPLTNLALAARLAPDIVPQVKEVVTMGGSFEAGAIAEFNAHCDPEAAHVVLGAGWPVRTIGLEITRRIVFTPADFARLPAGEPAVDLLRAQAPGWIERVVAMGWEKEGCALHDALAVAAVLEPDLFTWQAAAVEVELREEARRGITHFRPRPEGETPVRLAVDVDAGRCRTLIWRYLAGLEG